MAVTGCLIGWRLTFGGEDLGWEGALATVVEDHLAQVFVVVYDVTPEDEKLPNALSRPPPAIRCLCRQHPLPR
jgi:hypothetical protein